MTGPADGMSDAALRQALEDALAIWSRATGNTLNVRERDEICAQQMTMIRTRAPRPAAAPPRQSARQLAPAPEPTPITRHWSEID